MSRLGEQERALCATTAAWLDATRVLGWLGLLAGGMASAHLLLAAAQPGIATTLLLLLLVERYFALRLAFDAGVFHALAEGRIGAPNQFDHGLQQLGLGSANGSDRDVASRARGAMRLSRAHLVVVAMQVTLCAILLVRSAH